MKEIKKLLKKIETASEKEQIELLLTISKIYRNSDNTKSLEFAEKARNLAVKLGLELQEADSLSYISSVKYAMGKYHEVLKSEKTILKKYKKLKATRGIGWSLAKIGNCYWRLGNYDKSLKYFLDILDILKNNPNDAIELNTHNSIGLLNFSLERYEEAKEHFNKVKDICIKISDDINLSTVLNNLGMIAVKQKKYIDAINYVSEGYLLAKKNGKKRNIISSLNNLGIILIAEGNYKEALEKLIESETLIGTENFGYGFKSEILCNMAECYLNLDDFTNANTYIKHSLEIARKSEEQELIINSLKIEEKLAVLQNDHKRAYKAVIEINELEHTKHKIETSTKLQLQKMKVELENEKKINEVLKGNEQNLKAFFGAMDDFVLEIDDEGGVLSIAPTSEDNPYKPTNEMLGKNVFEVLSPKNADKLLSSIQQSLDENKIVSVEYQSKKGKKDIWFEATISPKTKNTVLLIAYDIMDQKIAEEELKQSEEKLRSVMSAMDDMVFVLDKENRFVSVNAESNDLYIKPEMFIGKKHSEVLPENVNTLFYNAIKNVKKGNTEEYEYSLNLPDAIHWYSLKLSPLFKDGKFNGSVAVIRDITDRKKAEEVLSQFKKIVESTSGHMAFVDTNYVYVEVNNSYTKAHKKKRKEIVGHSIAEIMGDEVFKSVIKEKIDACISGKTVKYEDWFDFAGTGRRCMDVSYYPYYNEDNKVAGIIVDSHDITERKKAEEELLLREHYLTALNKAEEVLIKDNLENLYQQFVEIIGTVSKASRTYIFLNHKNESGELLMSQKAEYCAEGITPEIDNPDLQNLKYNDYAPRWEKVLGKGEIISGKTKDLPEEEKEVLGGQGIKAILSIPIINEGEFLGFIGFDNCISEDEWQSSERTFLQLAANNLSQFIQRQNSQVELQSEFKRFQTTMDALDAMVYVADMKTYELLFCNKKFNDLMGEHFGEKCYSIIQEGQTKPCEFCTNHLLLDKKGNPKEPYIWEFQNTVTKRWFQCRDQAIHWTDGRLVRMEIAVDITERKLGEEEITKLSKIVETTSQFIVLSKIDGSVTYVNQAYLDASGYKASEVIGSSMFGFTTEEGMKILKEETIPHLLLSGHWRGEMIVRVKDGITFPAELICSLIKNKNDEPEYFVAVFNDITHKKQAEKEIKESKDFAENLLDTANSLIMTLDKKGNITSFNKYLEKLSSYTKEEVIGKNWFTTFIPEKDKEVIPKLFNETLDGVREVSNYENPIVMKNGDERIISWSNNKIFDSKKNVIGLLSIGSDITNQRLMEQELKEINDLLKAFSDVSEEAIFFYEDGFCFEANPRASKLFGYTHNELIGMFGIELIASQSKKNVSQNMFDDSGNSYDAIAQKKDGTTFYAEFHGRTYQYKNKKIRVTTIKDITKRKRTEESRKAIYRELTAERNIFSVGNVILFKWKNEESWPVEFVSDNVKDILGYSKYDFIIGKIKYSDIIYLDDRKKVFDEINGAKEKNLQHFMHLPYRINDKSGRIKWVYHYTSIIKNDDNKDIHFLGHITDVTELYTVKEALSESESRWQFAIDGSELGLWDWKVLEGKVFFSKQWKNIIGFKEDEISDDLEEWEKRIHPADIEKTFKDINDNLDGKTLIYSNEHRLQCKDGTYKWIMDRGKVIEWTEDNKPKRMIGTLTDISKRKENEQELKEINDLLKAFSDVSNEAILFNEKGFCIEANHRASELFGYTHKEMIGMCGTDIIAPQSKKLVTQNMLGGYEKPYDAIAQKKDGTTFYAEFNGRMYQYKNKKIRVTGIKDITKRKNNERKLEKYAQTQKTLFREVNHRVKNNLSSIISLIRKEKNSANNKGFSHLQIFDDLIGRIYGLAEVHSLLSQSEWQPIQLNHLCEKILRGRVNNLSLNNRIEIEIKPKNVDILINSNQAHQLALVINELATNSIKYGMTNRKTTTITVKLEQIDKQISVIFSDDGPGFTQEILNGNIELLGIGYDLINGIVSHTLGGNVKKENQNGAKTIITFESELLEKDWSGDEKK